jgi:hypothetical protein
MKLNAIDAVLQAADEWVSAQEALVAARQVSEGMEATDEWVSAQEALGAAQRASEEFEAEQEAVDLAGCRLVAVIMQWRSTREPT